jgi:hypothetical protein
VRRGKPWSSSAARTVLRTPTSNAPQGRRRDRHGRGCAVSSLRRLCPGTAPGPSSSTTWCSTRSSASSSAGASSSLPSSLRSRTSRPATRPPGSTTRCRSGGCFPRPEGCRPASSCIGVRSRPGLPRRSVLGPMVHEVVVEQVAHLHRRRAEQGRPDAQRGLSSGTEGHRSALSPQSAVKAGLGEALSPHNGGQAASGRHSRHRVRSSGPRPNGQEAGRTTGSSSDVGRSAGRPR